MPMKFFRRKAAEYYTRAEQSRAEQKVRQRCLNFRLDSDVLISDEQVRIRKTIQTKDTRVIIKVRMSEMS
jgi:hypothetical protein